MEGERTAGPYVCGVDLGGKRARLCFLDPADAAHPLMVRFEPTPAQMKTLDYIEAARWAAGRAPNVWATLTPFVVWVEQPFGGNPRANHQLSVMAGALMAGLPREASVEFVSATEARQLVGLPVRAKKTVVIEWATVESDADFVYDEHDADAYVVARAILAHGSRSDAETPAPEEPHAA